MADGRAVSRVPGVSARRARKLSVDRVRVRRRPQGLRAVLEKRGVESLDDVDREVIVAYESDLFGRGYAASTVDRHVSVLKGFHRFLVREGYARRNPADTIQLPKAPDRLPDVLSVAQVDAMLSRRWTKALWPFATGPSSRSCTVAGCA